MSEAEKLERHQKLLKVVKTHTSHTWSAILVKMLLGQVNSQNTARQTPYLARLSLGEQYHKAQKRLFLFDYDVSHLMSSCFLLTHP
jgi:trehalose 6-phosphate synthase/phosphatase